MPLTFLIGASLSVVVFARKTRAPGLFDVLRGVPCCVLQWQVTVAPLHKFS
eukprot:CAMPEP_0196662950 /NCGR_PEP_ID=MMETSP1086-20130531/50981_1 /TAXON_ID=77921 /ORGANISM="Cyanoptyche  gloeocystis , Strain SAG4.97" /LENGTH=50 /DNA_ID=CAMNT_0041998587 /DNA_START=278 /DNA_END=430 /DNA_ORIENTATION=+